MTIFKLLRLFHNPGDGDFDHDTSHECGFTWSGLLHFVRMLRGIMFCAEYCLCKSGNILRDELSPLEF
jgi:hypothetical protein